MSKSHIIIADTDEKIIAPLELKFLEELEDEVELEIITDEAYFNEYFSSPRNANILVISENFYSDELRKHNFLNIVVLTESFRDVSYDNSLVTTVFKYSNINDVYKQITSRSFIKEESTNKETTVLLVYSASGGTGKTSISLSICAALSKAKRKVLYINAEKINTYQVMLNDKSSIPNNVVSEFLCSDQNIFGRIESVIRNEGFDYLPPFNTSLSSLGLDFGIYNDIILSAKATNKYDLIVVDTDSAFDTEKSKLITNANKVIILLNQNINSVFATNTLLKNISFNDKDKYFFICNNYDETKNNALVLPNYVPNFVVYEYVKHFENFEFLGINEMANQYDIQKLSYLFM